MLDAILWHSLFQHRHNNHPRGLPKSGYVRTASVLAKELGFHFTREEGNRFRYETVSGSSEGLGSIVDVLCIPYTLYGVIGVGTIRRVAWQTPTDEQQKVLHHKIIKAGLNATPVIDRIYFHSVYFREPGGVLFEIATNPPGFMVDEKAEDLGTHLCFRLGSNLCVRIYLYLRKEKSNNVKQKTTTS
jgi:glyoxalase family protein